MDRYRSRKISFVALLAAGSFLCAEGEMDRDFDDRAPPKNEYYIRVKKDLDEVAQLAQSDYKIAAIAFNHLIQKGVLSEEDIDNFFCRIKEALDSHRYKNHGYQKKQIVDLALLLDPVLAKDIDCLIDKVISLFQDLKIEYHDIQHTLEVVLGTTRAVFQGVREGLIKDPKEAFLAIVAALFHDVGYSNAKEVRVCIHNLYYEEYASLFCAVKDKEFLESFQSLVKEIENKEDLTGAELHLYHVPLSQLLLPMILKGVPDDFLHKEFFLSKESLEKINAMIALTDIKPDVNQYRENRRRYLREKGLLFAGESVTTCDLLTQLSTSDRLGKGLGLYEEFYLGHDDRHWESGLALMSTTTEFYEFFAKKQLNVDVLSALDRYFAENFSSANPYRIGSELVFFLHKLFEPLYEKLTALFPITDEDMNMLKGLQKNGLQKEVVDLFIAMKMNRENLALPADLEKSLTAVLQEKGSLLEIAIGDEIRLALIWQAILFQDDEKIKGLLEFKKPGFLANRLYHLKSFFPG